ncbi:tRNA (adenosine(37)-N6)-threonylcarbamoyltransferase complex dimerization subunit type 1 TsaB [Sphingobium sp. B11D3D]|uniref:tRNA (adenosine(37)-N6)-threonylcarbamoyltransferase complex dimerization subunit type 1 TsaB n=1 Tax=Sphingobium sp. B11D3D TaxID=2940576 RepID=UPI002224E292|nr:tRNA (adenosine(37)-N6)-threonylcarbamoyltransferase complex dimerization subunit type 1 TsaB [Sphingobium sp. B11D3D]
MSQPLAQRTLIIDCATPALSIALFDGDRLIEATHRELGRGHAEALLPAVAALPEGGRADAILVNIGPGSFTGVRVGLAAARALGFAWQVPVSGYGCLDLVAAIARAQLGPTEPFAVTMVGGHGEIFWAEAASSVTSDRPPLTVRSTPIDELAASLRVGLLVGSGAQTLVDAGARGQAVPLLPDARAVFRLPVTQRTRPPVPDYGRGADAKPMAALSKPRPAPVR